MAKRKGPAPDLERERFWRSVVEGWSASGLSIREWCRRRQVSEPSFYAWRRELNRRTTRRTGVNSVAPLLLPITIEPSHTTTTAAPLVIELSGVVRVHVRSGCDAVLLATVLRTLREAEPGCGEASSC